MVASYTTAAIAAERQSVSESTAELLQATADAAVDAAAQAIAQRAFVAGQRHTAAEINAKSRVRRVVERDTNGQITGIVDVREPLPAEPAREPMGFRPRRPRQPSKETPE